MATVQELDAQIAALQDGIDNWTSNRPPTSLRKQMAALQGQRNALAATALLANPAATPAQIWAARQVVSPVTTPQPEADGGRGTMARAKQLAAANAGSIVVSDEQQALANAHAAQNTPQWQAVVNAYNTGQQVPDEFVPLLNRLNSYFQQGQAAPGNLTPDLATSALRQWGIDAQPGGFEKFMNIAAPLALGALTGGIGGIGAIGGLTGAGAAAAGGAVAGATRAGMQGGGLGDIAKGAITGGALAYGGGMLADYAGLGSAAADATNAGMSTAELTAADTYMQSMAAQGATIPGVTASQGALAAQGMIDAATAANTATGMANLTMPGIQNAAADLAGSAWGAVPPVGVDPYLSQMANAGYTGATTMFPQNMPQSPTVPQTPQATPQTPTQEIPAPTPSPGTQPFDLSNPSTYPWGQIASTGLNLAGGYLQGRSATDAAQTAANAQIEAARIAAEASKFKPVGVTTRFGQSQFGYDAAGNLTSAGYQLSPEAKAQQDALMGMSNQMLTQYQGAPAAAAPMGQAAQTMFGLGQGYLQTSPQAQAQQYMAEQQALLAPSRERDLAQLQAQMQAQGRGGLAVGGTSTGMTAANPQLEAYYNAKRMQDLQLAAQATQGGQQYAQFGAGMVGTGGEMLQGMYGTQQAAYSPYQTALGGATSLEALGQKPMDIGTAIGAKTSTAAAQAGMLQSKGLQDAATAMQPANAYNPWATMLSNAGNAITNYQTQQQQQQQQQFQNNLMNQLITGRV